MEPHSAELLPDGNIVAASSSDNRLRLFCTVVDSASFVDYTLPSAHGVVWDHKRQVLWTIGHDKLRTYQYNFDRLQPELTLLDSISLPDPGGHDLFPRLKGKTLFVTTGEHVWEFDPETQSFLTTLPMHLEGNVKSICESYSDGRIAYMQACESWWCDTIQFVNPLGQGILKEARFYKARWMVENPFSYGSVDIEDK